MSKLGTGRLVVALALLLGAGSAVRAAEPRALVVSSIRPVHLILLALAGDRVDARVLLAPGVSPHDFALQPSQVRLLAEARQVFWIGPTLEHPLVTVFERLPPPPAMSADRLSTRSARSRGCWATLPSGRPRRD